MKKNIDFLVIVGATGVGKSQFAINLAKRCNGEIINGDSVQIYKGLNIGSAKVTKEEMHGIEHHLIDIKEPYEKYNSYNWQQDCLIKIEEIKKRNKLPIIVGGTGLYITSIIYDYEFNNGQDKDYKLLEELKNMTNLELYEIVINRSLEEGIEIHENNRQRLISYAYKIKKKIPLKQNKLKMKNMQLLLLNRPRAILYDKINLRVDNMIEQGLIEEVKKFDSSWASQTAIGYKEIHKYLEKKISKEDAIEEIKKNTRHFAKRQITWFKNKLNAEVCEMEEK